MSLLFRCCFDLVLLCFCCAFACSAAQGSGPGGQAKFKIPRNTSLTKSWDKMWRPQIHCIGVLISGLVECYFLLDCNQHNDSNCEATILTHALDVALEYLKGTGRALPQNLHVQGDNTCRELRNQYLWIWGCSLVSKGNIPVSQLRLPPSRSHPCTN